jgi:hypothetical protein
MDRRLTGALVLDGQESDWICQRLALPVQTVDQYNSASVINGFARDVRLQTQQHWEKHLREIPVPLAKAHPGKFLVTTGLSLSITFLFGQNADKIGDIKYSLLEPNIFIKLHDSTWVLMDGRDIGGSALSRLGWKTIPDARGVFLRGMNVNRDIHTGDESGNRPVGSYQKDQLMHHKHSIDIAVTNDNKGGVVRGGMPDRNGSTGYTNESGAEQETNPRNISVYTYIKIN